MSSRRTFVVLATVLLVLTSVLLYVFIDDKSSTDSYPVLKLKSPLQVQKCPARPSFLDDLKLGADPQFATQNRDAMGLVLQYQVDGQTFRYQDDSFKEFGHLGAVVFDPAGNFYTHPAPFINILETPISGRNNIYWIPARTGKLEKFASLPAIESSETSLGNVFGVMGLTYDCLGGSLLASNVSASDQGAQNGRLYRIDAISRKVEEIYKGEDMFGLAVAKSGDKKYLLAGSMRDSQVFALDLASLDLYTLARYQVEGLMLDARVKKIVQDTETGDLVLTTLPFRYTLAASSEDRSEQIHLSWDTDRYVQK